MARKSFREGGLQLVYKKDKGKETMSEGRELMSMAKLQYLIGRPESQFGGKEGNIAE